MTESIQEDVAEFERNRGQLATVASQKNQLQLQNTMLGAALEELANSKEKRVYKAVGNILILSESRKVEKELKEQKESAELRLKSLQKQEEALLDKLNKIKSRIESYNKKENDSTTSN